MAKEEKKREGKRETERGPQTQLVFECAVCEKAYDHPGMCQACHVLLKPRGG